MTDDATSTSLTPTDSLTVKETAHILQVAPKTIYTWCYQGKIGFFKIMGSVRIRKDAVKAVRFPK
jgi:excisionase family DNA binding protein